MIQFVYFSRPEYKKKLIDDAIENRSCIVVSDLKSKFEIQNIILARKGFFDDQDIIRVSELWLKLLKMAQPFLEVVDTEYALILIKEVLQNKALELFQLTYQVGLENRIYDQFEQWSVLLTHPEAVISIKDALSTDFTDSEHFPFWWKSLLLAQYVFNELINAKLLPKNSIDGFLLNHFSQEKDLQLNLTLDLGCNLSKTEAEIFQRISRFNQIDVLMPQFPMIKQYRNLLAAYSLLDPQKNLEKILTEKVEQAPTEKKYVNKKFYNNLAEVKQTVFDIRGWLESGIKPNEIAVISNKIESYWPILQTYLAAEGVPIQKDLVGRMSLLTKVNEWISYLKLQAKQVNFSILESVLFSESRIKINYSDFVKDFKNIIEFEDLNFRRQIVDKLSIKEQITGLEFAFLVLKTWKETEKTFVLDFVLKECLQLKTSTHEFKDWIYLFELKLNKKEFTITSGDPQGVLVLNLQSADLLTIKKRVYLGLSESNLRNRNPSIIPIEHLKYINVAGFFVIDPDEQDDFLRLDWNFQNNQIEDHFYFSLFDFAGSEDGASLFWLNHDRSRSADTVDLPKWTYLDFLNSQSNELTERWNQPSLTEDLSDLVKSHLKKMSYSQLNNYIKCPFIFKSEVIYGLRSKEAIDLETGAMSSGSIIHFLFEQLSLQLKNTGKVDVEKALEDIYLKFKSEFYDDKFWLVFKSRLTLLAKKYVDFETQFKIGNPNIKFLSAESKFKLYFDQKNKKWLGWREVNDQPQPDWILFSGKIDRLEIDEVAKAYSVVDYKNKLTKVSNWQDWIEKDDFQLGLYVLAVEHNALLDQELKPWPVNSAMYYSYAQFKRDKGMVLNIEGTTTNPAILENKKLSVSPEDKSKLLVELTDCISDHLTRIFNNHFEPVPKDLKTCIDCDWKYLCRAPHLQ